MNNESRRSLISEKRSTQQPINQTEQDQLNLVDVLDITQQFIANLFKNTFQEIKYNEISAQVDGHSIRRSFSLAELLIQPIIYDTLLINFQQDQEPIKPELDQWRRVTAAQKQYIRQPSNKVDSLNESFFEEKKPEWEPYEPQMILTGIIEDDENLYDQQLRTQLEYKEQCKIQYQALQEAQEKMRQEEKRKIRVLVDGSPERVTYDIDGKIIIKNSKITLPKLSGRIKGNEYIPPLPIVNEFNVIKIPRMKYKHKVFKLLPKIEENPETLKIIQQQEYNHDQELLQKLELQPGVFIQLGDHQQGYKQFPTQASSLPYKIQSSFGQYLQQEQSQSIRLSKEEYSSMTLNGSIINNNQMNKQGGSYEQSYINKKSSKSQKSQSIAEDYNPKAGIVKVNDIGKFYDLLIKDTEPIIEGSENQIEQNISEDQQQQQSQLIISPVTKQLTNNSKSQVDLPSIPATQFYRYLTSQQKSESKILDNSSQTGSLNSKITRDRQMPEAINNLKVHRFLAAPKVGKYLGFGVNAKYKF